MPDVMTAPRKFVKSTIQDVAALAGVSRTTVSHFVSGNKRACAPETAERIRGAIAALHYAPSMTVRGSRLRPTRAIGLCIESTADLRDEDDHRNSYQERLWRAVVRETDTATYTLMHYPSQIRHGCSTAPFLDGRIDGLLFGARRCDERPAEVVAAGLPTVVLNRYLDLPAGCGAVYCDENDTARLALDHLWELGHRRIAHLAGPIGLRTGDLAVDPEPARLEDFKPSDIAIRRCESYSAYLQARGAFDPSLVSQGRSWWDADVDAIVAAWFERPDPPTAVFCANDTLALAVIRAARLRGLRVPEDLSVVGVDNRVAATESDPRLTSVDIPTEELGREAVRLLVRLMEDSDPAPDEMTVALPVTRLIVRDSTARVR